MLAIDCGGSHTRAGLYGDSGTLVSETEGGPANPIAGGIEQAVSEIARLAQELNTPIDAVIALGIAGARNNETREAIWAALAHRFPGRRIVVSDDQTPILFVNNGGNGSILITAGTGSCVLAVNKAENVVRKGGRGPLLGDDGSAFAIAADALKRAARAEDGAWPSTSLTERFPSRVGMADFDDLVGWQRDANKAQIAALAQTVCAAADDGDAVARECVREQAALLAAIAQAARVSAKLDAEVEILLNGGLLEHSPLYANLLAESLTATGFTTEPILARFRGHTAVHEMASRGLKRELIIDRVADSTKSQPELPATERKSDGPALDSLDSAGIVNRMIATNRDVDVAMIGAADTITEAVDHAAAAISSGGRVIYAGAGTSGRLAVLDAAECRPTFGVEEGRVIALIAGGDRALVESVEEAEDNRQAGCDDLMAITPPVGENDFVLGITASGTTPYACAVVELAAEQGARTALLTCNGDSPSVAPLMIRLATGPEALPGSTRLKAGTATKLALNIISTGAFARAGHIFDGWMVGVRPINSKLRARAARIIGAITGLNSAESQTLLEDAGNRIPVALIMNKFKWSRDAAESRLREAGEDVRAVLDA